MKKCTRCSSSYLDERKSSYCIECHSLRLKEYRANNKEAISHRERQYRKDNREAITIREKQYRERTKENRRERAKSYHKLNPDVARRAFARRKARKLQNGFEHYTENDVLGLYGTECHICAGPIDLDAPRSIGRMGWENSLHIDHLVPLSKGGSDTIDNVRPSHGKCNLSKGSKFDGK